MMARIIELILTDKPVGKGDVDEPYRVVYELWTKGGVIVASSDPVTHESWFDARSVNTHEDWFIAKK
jgi:hypothetical protein